jgi:hypothetical protein
VLQNWSLWQGLWFSVLRSEKFENDWPTKKVNNFEEILFSNSFEFLKNPEQNLKICPKSKRSGFNPQYTPAFT